MSTTKKKKAKLIIWLVVIAVIIGIIVMVVRNIIGGAAVSLTLFNQTCGKAKQTDLINYVNLSGKVSSSDKVSVSGEQSLKVKKLNVKVGDNVKKGDVLCVFDSAELEEQYNTLVANSEKAKGASDYNHSINQRNLDKAKNEKTDALNKAKEAISNAEKKRDEAYNKYNDMRAQADQLYSEADDAYNEMLSAEDENAAADAKKRWQTLSSKAETVYEAAETFESNLSSYDDAVKAANSAYDDAVKSADSVIQSAQDVIDAEKYSVTDTSSEKQIKTLKEQIEKCTVKAPKDGVITQLNISEGSVPITSELMTIENTSELVIAGKVNEADILKIEEGMEADVKTSATGDKIIAGKVKRIERIISSESQDALGGYTVEVSIEDKESGLLIGMSANVKIILDKRTDVLAVPFDAVEGGENDGYFVFVAVPNGDGKYTVRKRTMEKGFEGDYYTEVLKGDIKAGDIVITDPAGIDDGFVIPLDVPED